MIDRFSHSVVFVSDQDVAKDFYVNKLGLELMFDRDLGAFRWLTVSARGQRDLQLVLMPVLPGSNEMVKECLRDGLMPTGVFQTDDCDGTYEELLQKGVKFVQPPTERFFGMEATLEDPFGNRFNLTGPKRSEFK